MMDDTINSDGISVEGKAIDWSQITKHGNQIILHTSEKSLIKTRVLPRSWLMSGISFTRGSNEDWACVKDHP